MFSASVSALRVPPFSVTVRRKLPSYFAWRKLLPAILKTAKVFLPTNKEKQEKKQEEQVDNKDRPTNFFESAFDDDWVFRKKESKQQQQLLNIFRQMTAAKTQHQKYTQH